MRSCTSKAKGSFIVVVECSLSLSLSWLDEKSMEFSGYKMVGE